MSLLSAPSPYKRFARELRKSDCRDCTLCEERNKIVVDRGNPHAKILLVGEAPGEEEDKTGKAFVGAAGRLLDQHLRFCGVGEQDIIIINTVKCRPPENRKPSKKELAACSKYFWKQISLLSPKWIVLLGASAFEAVLQPRKKVQVSHFAGRFLRPVSFNAEVAERLGDARVFVQFHPSYCLHNPSAIPTVLNAWKIFWKEVANAQV